jgi:hypothetical protein
MTVSKHNFWTPVVFGLPSATSFKERPARPGRSTESPSNQMTKIQPALSAIIVALSGMRLGQPRSGTMTGRGIHLVYHHGTRRTPPRLRPGGSESFRGAMDCSIASWRNRIRTQDKAPLPAGFLRVAASFLWLNRRSRRDFRVRVVRSHFCIPDIDIDRNRGETYRRLAVRFGRAGRLISWPSIRPE